MSLNKKNQLWWTIPSNTLSTWASELGCHPGDELELHQKHSKFYPFDGSRETPLQLSYLWKETLLTSKVCLLLVDSKLMSILSKIYSISLNLWHSWVHYSHTFDKTWSTSAWILHQHIHNIFYTHVSSCNNNIHLNLTFPTISCSSIHFSSSSSSWSNCSCNASTSCCRV